MQDHLRNGLPHPYTEPFAYNTTSCRVYEKAGFQYEGALRSNVVKNGNMTDMKMHSIIIERRNRGGNDGGHFSYGTG